MSKSSEAVNQALDALLKVLTPEQLSIVQEKVAQASNMQSVTFVEQNDEEVIQVAHRATVHSKVSQSERQVRKKKALNGFITFRGLSGLTQKVRSGIMRQLWTADNHKSIFGLLGEAYSVIRDKYTRPIALDQFLSNTIELLPVIPADQYFTKMGWELAHDDDNGEIRLERSSAFNVSSLQPEHPSHTNLSVKDLVEHCAMKGLIGQLKSNDHDSSVQGKQVMVNTDQIAARLNSMPFAAPASVAGPFSVNSSNQINNIARHSQQLTTTSSASHQNMPPTIEAVTSDQLQAYHKVPLALHFHPNIHPPILGFDPRMVQHDFDPFSLDLSELIDLGIDMGIIDSMDEDNEENDDVNEMEIDN